MTRVGVRSATVGSFHELPCAEGDDAADWIVRRDADRHAVARDDLDSETPHAAAQLGEYFVPRVALHAVQPAGMDRDDGSLHIYQIVFAQQLILSRAT
jgi:hypothetical protein